MEGEGEIHQKREETEQEREIHQKREELMERKREIHQKREELTEQAREIHQKREALMEQLREIYQKREALVEQERRVFYMDCTTCGCNCAYLRLLFSHQLQNPPTTTAAATPPPTSFVGPSQPTMERAAEEQTQKRTKFTNEQKDRMWSLAENIGWKMPFAGDSIRGDEAAAKKVQRFCLEIGVAPEVFKTWINGHRNKRSGCSSTGRCSSSGGNAAAAAPSTGPVPDSGDVHGMWESTSPHDSAASSTGPQPDSGDVDEMWESISCWFSD